VADEPDETILTMLRALDAKVDRLTGDVDAVKGKVDRLTDDVDTVKGKVDRLTDDVDAVKGKVDRLTDDVEAMKGKINAWPDLNFLQAVAQRQLSEAREAREFRRHVEIKLDEIYGSMATSSEITKLRQEVANSIDREDELDLRISAIEIRLGIKNPLAPEQMPAIEMRLGVTAPRPQ
jgi:outer membrane murein-binding lipoprotein Lpp